MASIAVASGTPALRPASDFRRTEIVQTARHLLVDGQNVLHAWAWLGGAKPLALATARARLIEEVRAIHDAEGIHVTVVFDTQKTGREIEPAETDETFAVVYASAAETADTVIERAVSASAAPAACVVATADRLQREAVLALGGEAISPEALREWTQRARARVTDRVRRGRAAGGEFGNRLPL